MSQETLMAENTYPIKGIPLVQGQEIPVRREITAWVSDPSSKYQVSLFIQSLAKLQAIPVEERLSYFQVAGIHCYPLVGWDGEKGVPKKEDQDPFPGYCAHNRVTFPTWHRPYLLLFEQVLYELMLEIITSWGLNDRHEEDIWRNAASLFRLPYWDWARKNTISSIPQICTLEKIEIVMPGGQDLLFSNPLICFRNPKLDKEGKNVAMGDPLMEENAIEDDTDVPEGSHILPWSKCVATSRYGIRADQPDSVWRDGINNWQACDAGLADPQWYGEGSGSLTDAVSRMLTPGYFDHWEPFASTVHNSPKNATNFMSLEYIHNIVHNATGGLYMSDADIPKDAKGYEGLGLGHMSDVPVAAFDPIFWLHHCNVDRLLAMWQFLNDEKWFDAPQSGDPTPDSPLLPFHTDTMNSKWTSDKCRDWKKLNYHYDDLVPQPDTDKAKHLEDVQAHIRNLYPSTSDLVKNTGASHDGEFNDYIINVIYDRYALKGRAYAILFFIGHPPQALSQYRESKSFVGAVYTFSAPVETDDGSTACKNCAEQMSGKVRSKAQVPITLPLLAKARQSLEGGHAELGQEFLRRENVETLLHDPEEGLNWEFVALGGSRLEPTRFPNTEIAVLHGTGSHPEQRHHLPRYRGYKRLIRATHNKWLGAGHVRNRVNLIKDDV